MSDIREMAIVFGHVVQHYGDPAKAVYEQHRIIEAQTAELNRLRAEVASLKEMADEYQDWIYFHNAGNGDYSDFLRSKGLVK